MILKIAVITAVALCIGFSASAQQQGKMAVGAYLGVGTGPSVGIGGKFQYGISDPVRLEGSLGFMFGESNEYVSTSLLDLSINAHYLFSLGDIRLIGDKMTPAYLYPLAGLGVYEVTGKYKAGYLGHTVKVSETLVGLNIGCGFEQYFNDKFSYFMELKLGVGNDLSRFTATWGMAYHF